MLHRDESFGIVPLSKEKGEWRVFLIQHLHGRYWGFPKGHAEAGEAPQEAATRELREETGLVVAQFLPLDPLEEQYQFMFEGKKIYKRVAYYLAEVEGKVRLEPQEIQDGGWYTLGAALERLTHPEGKNILSQVAKILLKA